ncbi:MAG: RNA 2'-phosphotransferase [Fastidiosipilaceae bacterium]|jgi:putative RNA 2'-phosphotransferase|nr:RNA 2'-phosphotransferase [Clostridiaceae bacterium]
MNYKKLSKEISYALRHAPEKYGLTLAADGSVPLNDLIQALRQRRWPDLEQRDIEHIIVTSTKKRHEINGDRIRATYGHTAGAKIEKQAVAPPDTLYHGTSHRAWQNIQKSGLKPMGRHYVHLSSDYPTAIKVGQRRDPRPIILAVAAKEAFQAGVSFYPATDGTWNADPIPPQFLTIMTKRP